MEVKNKEPKRGQKAFIGLLMLVVIPAVTAIFISWKLGLGFFILNLIIKIIKIKKRGYFAKDTSGEKLGVKRFMSRWKEGIEGITPLQQARTNLLGTWITLSGVISGIVINALIRMSNQWIWIEIILVGSLILVVMQMIGGIQKYWKFKESDKIQKKFEEDMKKELEKAKKKEKKK